MVELKKSLRQRRFIRSDGYTIVEVLIFLAVSGLMFVMAMAFISGQQNRAQFVNNTREFESVIADIANDVATGYYQRPIEFSCNDNGAGGRPSFSTATEVEQGANNDCIFIGTVLKFGDSSDNETGESYTQFAVAGRRLSSNIPVTTLADSLPTVIYNDSNLINAAATKKHSYGARVECVAIGTGPCNPGNNAAIGFFNKLNGNNSRGDGSGIQTDLVVYDDIEASDPLIDAKNVIDSASYDTDQLNPAGGIRICLVSGVTNQHAWLQIGGSTDAGNPSTTNNLSVTSEVSGGTTCT